MPNTNPQLQKVDTMVTAIMTLAYEQHEREAAAPAFADAFNALHDELQALKMQAPQAYFELKARAEQEMQPLNTTLQVALTTAQHYATA